MARRTQSITPKYFGLDESVKIPRITYTANALRFQSEEDLEIYIENLFDDLFPDLDLIQRQFRLHTQPYDLLCRNKHNHQAVLLELKNEEDRSIIWQLVRYRYLILSKQPFPEKIDYSLSIELGRSPNNY
jgi:RecB family endonuclease NucS